MEPASHFFVLWENEVERLLTLGGLVISMVALGILFGPRRKAVRVRVPRERRGL
jgi:hypothetical protein